MNPPHFPFQDPPAAGRTIEVAPGLLWLRLPLPFRLDHVNAYLIEARDGWTVLDTGVDDARTRGIWCGIIDTIFASKPLRRVIATHFHPDHVGAAAFLCARTGATLMMDETEYLTAKVYGIGDAGEATDEQAFYRRHGLRPDEAAALARRRDRYRANVPDLPRRFEPLREGDRLDIGRHAFVVRRFGGHSPAQTLLHAADSGLLIAADHILPGISPNISVAEEKPADDPLGLYLASFEAIRASVADSVLVLPGHRMPFRGLHGRTRALAAHHAERCATVLDACRPRPLSAAAILPLLFPLDLDDHQLWFAFSETLAHVNHLARRGALTDGEREGIRLWRSAEAAPSTHAGGTP